MRATSTGSNALFDANINYPSVTDGSYSRRQMTVKI